MPGPIVSTSNTQSSNRVDSGVQPQGSGDGGSAEFDAALDTYCQSFASKLMSDAKKQNAKRKEEKEEEEEREGPR